MTSDMNSADFVIVGGGSAGCVLAARLSENGRHKVLLIEAGPSDRRVDIDVPIGYAHSYRDPKVNWMFDSAPVPALGNRVVYYPRGKVLGGSGSINAMVFARGQPQDYEDWEAAGNRGWGWRDVLPFYRGMESHDLGASDLHGGDGPMQVTQMGRDTHPICENFFRAAQELGFRHLRDLNGAETEGVGHYQVNIRKGRRHSSARAYLRPALKRANLKVVTNALVLQLIVEDKRVAGLRYRQDGCLHEVRAQREVVLAAGAIGSPQLLQLSGIGAAEELRSLGIEVKHDLPAVGRNLMDHICYDHYFEATVPTLNSSLGNWPGRILAGARYALQRRGPLSMSLNQAGGFVRSSPLRERPNIQLYFCPLAYEKVGPESRQLIIVRSTPAFSLSISPCRPKSRGHVRLRSAEAGVAPEIQPNLLSHPDDLTEAVEGARLMRRLANTKALGGIVRQETKPGEAARSDAEFAAYIKESCYSIFHPSGTCRMGPDATDSAVDARLRVHGLDGLRVIDASIFPTIPSANTNAPTMMVAEKGAAFILGEG
ncbi:GMC family oxidoreductase [Dongia sp.]|uniref:GMC family oxidoreductase n=1 Tax=Dongia sp. TaxID=1977262 RepID=UPI0035B4291D